MANKLEGLQPRVKSLAEKLISECVTQGINIIITQGYRSIAEQNKLYAMGRTVKGKIVTNAKGGTSYHNYGLAFDICPLINGKCAWGREDLFNKIGVIGKKLGLEWGGDFKSIKDRPHFQYSFGLSIRDLLSGERPKDTLSNDATPKPKIIMKGITIPPLLNCYPIPSAAGKENGKIQQGKILNIYKTQGDWYLVNSINPQWVKKNFIKII